MPDVKSYDYVLDYFSDSRILVAAIKEYHRTAKIPKGEYTKPFPTDALRS